MVDLSSLLGTATSTMQSMPVIIRSNLNASKPITLTPLSSSASGTAEPNPVMEMLQPEIVVQTPAGPMTYAPYGTPSQDEWPYVVIGLGFAAIAFMGLGALIKIPAAVTAVAGVGALAVALKLRG